MRLSRLVRRLLPIAVLVASVSACKSKASPNPTAAADSSTVAAPTGDDALASAAWPAGIDPDKLDQSKRRVFDQVVESEASMCGVGQTLLYAVKRDRACKASFYAARYVVRLAEAGLSGSAIGEKLSQRFRVPPVPHIDVSHAPSKGSPSGAVTIVEFADYECSHCEQAQRLMKPLLEQYANDVTLYFKHFPITSPNAINAALAATAAQNQGMFWEFSDRIWENWNHLSPAVLEGIAKDVGLDYSRWYEDLGSEAVRGQVQADKAEARALQIHRTPALFINGRKYSDEIDLPSLKDWIDEALGR